MFRAAMCPSPGEITIYATLGIYHSMWMTVWYASLPLCQLAGKVFTHKCDTGNLSALIQC